MKLESASKLVNTLLNKNYTVNGKTFNLIKSGWNFKGFDKAVKRIGVCTWGARGKYIGLSAKMTEIRSKDEVEQTILHEIAHAIDVEIRGTSSHDNVWKSIARSIGHSGNRCVNIKESIETRTKIYKWVAFCDVHGILGGWSRKPTNAKICRTCRKPILIVPPTDERVINFLKK